MARYEPPFTFQRWGNMLQISGVPALFPVFLLKLIQEGEDMVINSGGIELCRGEFDAYPSLSGDTLEEKAQYFGETYTKFSITAEAGDIEVKFDPSEITVTFDPTTLTVECTCECCDDDD